MSKKILIIIIIIFITIILGMLTWSFLLKPNTKTTEQTTGVLDFLPFGKNNDQSTQIPFFNKDELSEKPVVVDNTKRNDSVSVHKLKQVTTTQISGATATTSQTGETTIRLIERSTGNIFDINTTNSEKKRITNTTIIASRETFFNSLGETLLMRYLNENDVIKTFMGHIQNPETGKVVEEELKILSNPAPVGESSGQLTGTFLEDDITTIALSPSKDAFFSLAPLGINTIGTVTYFKNNTREQIFSSSFPEWLTQWPKKDTVTLTTKAASVADGFFYFLNSSSGKLERVMGNIKGLTTNTNTDATKVLYSQSVSKSLSLHALDVKTHTTESFTIKTLPEKCVWSALQTDIVYCGVPGRITEGQYPDFWYQGIVSFSDTLWKINVSTNTTELLSVPVTSARAEIDVVQPFLNNDETLLLFTNKKDSTLWSLEL